jgi:hypothetical protein
MFVFLYTRGISQDSSQSLIDKIISFPDKVFARVDKQAATFEQKINRQTEKYLSKLERQEEKLKRKLWKTDSIKAKEVFGDIKERYDALRNSMKAQGDKVLGVSNLYNGHIDSVNTAIRFLQNSPQLQQGSAGVQKLSNNLQSVTSLQNKLNQTEHIRKQIAQRQQQLKQQLQNTPLMKEFTKYRKQLYYYQQQVLAYKEALNDPKQMGAKLLQTAVEFPAFKQFFVNNSELASLFRLPDGNLSPFGGTGGGYGLQTRADVVQGLQDRFGVQTFTAPAGGGASPFQQQLQAAQGEMQKLKDRFSQVSPTGGDLEGAEMPDFKKNDQKTKSFKQRIDLSTNFQTTRGRAVMPNAASLGLSIGYKLNDKSIAGFGFSYSAGLGTGFNNIRLTHNGVGYRSFLDWKAPFGTKGILGNLWISGGYEWNYNSAVARSLQNNPATGTGVRDNAAWKSSALLGVSRVIDIKSKFFKKTKLQLCYDFLWKQPGSVQTQPIVFRTSYNF